MATGLESAQQRASLGAGHLTEAWPAGSCGNGRAKLAIVSCDLAVAHVNARHLIDFARLNKSTGTELKQQLQGYSLALSTPMTTNRVLATRKK